MPRQDRAPRQSRDDRAHPLVAPAGAEPGPDRIGSDRIGATVLVPCLARILFAPALTVTGGVARLN